MTTGTSEKGLEAIIVQAMTGRVDSLSPPCAPTETFALRKLGSRKLTGRKTETGVFELEVE